jgi:competence protein ComEA
MFKKVLMSLFLAMVLSTGFAYAMDKININTATQSELQLLNGVGESTAAAIIQYREENGMFKSVEDLVNVKGIGSKKIETLTDNMTVSKAE